MKRAPVIDFTGFFYVLGPFEIQCFMEILLSNWSKYHLRKINNWVAMSLG
jgi:hypothetical protein